MVTAEKNTNPFANGNAQNVCGDASLPATAELRGITPLIDPAVDTTGGVAALSKSSAASPLDATGKSVFDLLSDAGFGDLVVSQAAAGGAAAGGAAAGGAANNGNAQQNAGNNANNNQGSNNQGAAAGNANAGNNAGNNNACSAQPQGGNSQADNSQQGNNQAGSAAGNTTDTGAATGNSGAATGNTGAAAAGSVLTGGEDFGKCKPTIDFKLGRPGRKATEGTFQISDPLAVGGQQDALNPNIITNALCNQLTNVCGANAAAVTACDKAKALVQAAGTRDASTATLFNSALGQASAKRSVARAFMA